MTEEHIKEVERRIQCFEDLQYAIDPRRVAEMDESEYLLELINAAAKLYLDIKRNQK
jgi:hypothetical protein